MNDWDDVRYFLEVTRHGNVTGAARALGVNHSTVSRRIRSLEEKHGVRLFERVPSGYELTQEASDIYELALDIEEKNNAFARKLQGQDSRLQGKLSITMPHDVFEFFFADHIANFITQYPDITIDMYVAKGLKNLLAREADIAVRITKNPPEYLVGKKATHLCHALYFPKSWSKQKLTVSPTPIVTWNDEQAVPEWAIQECNEAKIVLRVDDLLSMYCAVEAGIGVARMPVFMHNMKKSEKVSRLTQPRESLWGIWVLNHVDLRKTARVQVCRQFLLACLESHSGLFQK